MKRNLYIGLFVFLGFLVQAFVHGSIEIAYSILLWRDLAHWGLGLTYQQWIYIHHVLSVLLLILGPWWGYQSGKFWWNYLYRENGELKEEFRRKWRW
jgi:hypothetical protein